MSELNIFELLRLAILGLIVPVTIYTELKDGKIYNWLTLPALLAGLLLAFLEFGWYGLRGHFWAAIMGAGIFYIPYLISGVSRGRPVVGGGDVKLCGAVGAIWGVDLTLEVIQWSIMSGAILGLSMVAWQSWRNRRVSSTSPEERISIWTMRIPFGTAICFGIIVSFTQDYLLSPR